MDDLPLFRNYSIGPDRPFFFKFFQKCYLWTSRKMYFYPQYLLSSFNLDDGTNNKENVVHKTKRKYCKGTQVYQKNIFIKGIIFLTTLNKSETFFRTKHLH